MVDESWTISELSERVADALANRADVPGGKARAIPDERAIRYYTTLGLLDRATLRGRTAYYGGRHLAQLIAIKKMQADGASLAEIQELLPAIDDVALAELTGVAIAARPRPAARRDFWRAAAEPVVQTDTVREPDSIVTATDSEADSGADSEADSGADSGTDSGADSGADSGTDSSPSSARGPQPEARGSLFTAEHHLELAPGVRLSIYASRVPTAADADALRVAAAAILAELARRRLVTPASHQRTKP